MKIDMLYINPKNVCTISLWVTSGLCETHYGLRINGENFEIGNYVNLPATVEEQSKQNKKVIKELEKLQQKIIDEIESEE